MQKSEGETRWKRSFSVRGNAVGAGVGTLLIAIASSLPASNPWKQWLALLAPCVSVALRAFVDWSRRNFREWIAYRQRRLRISRATREIATALRNPQTSAEHKDRLRRQLESLEFLSVRSEVLRQRRSGQGR